MTEIIPGLHQIGAHELLEVREASLIIDMGGIFNKMYAEHLRRGDIDNLKSIVHIPVVFLEIDEVDNEPFRQFSKKINSLINIAFLGAEVIRGGGVVYTLCLAGQNRSGLMSALIMIQLGHHPKDAVEMIQKKRELALNNEKIKYILSV